MHRPAVPDAYIAEVAERTGFSVDDVRIGLRVLHDAVQSRLAEQYRRARDPDSPDHLLVDDAGAAWFAFAFADLRAELEAAGYEMDADLLAAVAAVNMTVFQEVHDRTVSFPRDLADRSDTPFFYPVSVEKPADWREAETRSLRALVGLLESGSSPAAALDAWAVRSAGADPGEWAAVRGVDPDRVRANARKAPDPAPEAAGGLRAEPRDGVPDGPYDPETDRLFVPTTDQLSTAREAEEGGTSEADPTGDAGAGPGAAAEADGAGTEAGVDDAETTGGDAGAAVDEDPHGLADLDPADVDPADLGERSPFSGPAAADDADDGDLAGPAGGGSDDPNEGDADSHEGDAELEGEDDDERRGDGGGTVVDGAAAFERAETDDR